jgi:hypothetical protein
MLLFLAIESLSLVGFSSAASNKINRVANSIHLQTAPPPVKSGELDLGSIAGNVYRNNFLDMTYAFPEGWFVDRRSMAYENTQESTPPQASARSDQTTFLPSYILLMVSESAAEGIHLRNPHVLLRASEVPVSEKMTAHEFLTKAAEHLKDQSNTEVVLQPADSVFGGQAFARMDTRVSMLPHIETRYSADVISVQRGYYLQFSLFADTPEQLVRMSQTLNSIKFGP